MDTIKSFAEIKLDIRERRTEWLPLRSWTRCYIKIESIKCFPCYMKITFCKNVDEDDTSLVLRINIPGLELYPVKSRTKQFAYGLYWKQNRKQCIAFLSLDSKLSMEAHMKWMELQIQNLELYRREILQSSRCSRMEHTAVDGEDLGIYQNMNDTDRVKDVNDILGPLPLVPDSDKNWSRRVSGFSGIYEEIVEPSNRVRDSVIYEEMKINRLEPILSPPPLPPRVRKNTDCSSLQRSYTTPESDYYVKKKWNLFENVFGKTKKAEAKRRERPVMAVAPKPKELQLLKAKRNSFSSPDLTHLYCPQNDGLNNSGCANCSFENPTNLSTSNSYELENVCEEENDNIVEPEAISEAFNISQKIRPNFQLQLNSDMSAINLVGSSYNINLIENSSPRSQPAMSPPTNDGYLEMRPGRGFDMKKVEELDSQLMKNDVLYRLKYSFNSPITYKREFDYDPPVPASESFYNNESPSLPVVESHYVCMNQGPKFSPKVPLREVKSVRDEEHTYMPMDRIRESHQNIHNNRIESTNGTPNISRNKRHSVDDKIASYFPNYDVPVRCNGAHQRNAISEGQCLNRKAKTPESEVRNLDNYDQSSSKSRKSKRVSSFNTVRCPKSSSSSFNDNNNNNNAIVQEVTKKYATIARITSTQSESDKHSIVRQDSLISNGQMTKSGSVSPTTIKRFTSLPRFKKIDFSPLRLKISSVLQRNNSSGY